MNGGARQPPTGDLVAATTLLRIPEVARRLAVRRHAVKEWIRTGELPAVDVGLGEGINGLRVSEQALSEWIAARTTGQLDPRKATA